VVAVIVILFVMAIFATTLKTSSQAVLLPHSPLARNVTSASR
jgi:hypothetical protein